MICPESIKCKYAGGPDNVPTDPVSQQRLKEEALHQLGLVAALSAGLGVGGRSLLSLYEQMNPPENNPLLFTSPVPTPIEVPVPLKKEKKPQALPSRFKAAGTPQAPPHWTSKAPLWFQRVAGLLPDVTTNATLMGPWTLPAALGVGTAAGLTGWQFADATLRGSPENIADEALTKAEEEYEEAMKDQYRAAARTKKAGEDDFGINQLYAMWKEAGGPNGAGTSPLSVAGNVADTMTAPWQGFLGTENWEQLKGMLLASMLGVGGLTAYTTYNWAKSRDREKIMNQAIKLRGRQNQLATRPVVAQPVYVDVDDDKEDAVNAGKPVQRK
jgi:hypothetical protein